MASRSFFVGALLGGLLIWALLTHPQALESAWTEVERAYAGKGRALDKALKGAEEVRDGARDNLRKIVEKAAP